jgi:hypothetical protein
MPITTASYLLLQDAPVTISGVGSEHLETLNLPPEHISSSGDVLQFLVYTQNANNLVLEVAVNPGGPAGWQTEHTYGPSDENLARPFHEIIYSLVDGTNRVRFRITGGSGSARLTGIILWYRVSLPI